MLNKSLCDRVFKLCELYLKQMGKWELINDKQAMVELRKVKRFFGLLSHKCPLCQAKTPYYYILCRARDASGEPIGECLELSLDAPGELIYDSIMLLSLETPKFTICPNGHEIAKMLVNRGSGDFENDYLIHQFRGGAIASMWLLSPAVATTRKEVFCE